MLDVSNAIITQSPLSYLHTDEKSRSKPYIYNNQDVQLEDILNVRSLSISLRTATDAGAFMNEDNINNSFLRSDIKKS